SRRPGSRNEAGEELGPLTRNPGKPTEAPHALRHACRPRAPEHLFATEPGEHDADLATRSLTREPQGGEVGAAHRTAVRGDQLVHHPEPVRLVRDGDVLDAESGGEAARLAELVVVRATVGRGVRLGGPPSLGGRAGAPR